MQSTAARLVVLSLLAANPVASQDRRHEADVRSLDELQKRVDDAIVKADIDTYVALLTADAVLMPPNGPPIVGRDAIREWSRMNAKAFSFEAYRPTDAELVVAGDWAFRRATFEMILVPTAGGTKVRDAGKFVIIYKRERDGWKVARDIWNSNGPPNNELQRTRPAQATKPRR
jgi:ketosteroid isomerase-like protein